MIAIQTIDGKLLKTLHIGPQARVGFHPLFGFITEAGSETRLRNRRLHGDRERKTDWAFMFEAVLGSTGIEIRNPVGCTPEKQPGAWRLATALGNFLITDSANEATPIIFDRPSDDPGTRQVARAAIGALIACLALIFLLGRGPEVVVVPEVLEPVAVKIIQDVQKAVAVPAEALSNLPKLSPVPEKNVQAKRAVDQNLGFLGLLGRKDLTKALGGVPTQLKDASPGAGPGGKEGSGGELLTGLGQGVKRTTVGNSGVAGLGGIGTKGAGGGAGGYGNASVGSGDGRALSVMPLSQDIVLDGGLDRAVIMATIAKYLSQIRACYETGLRTNPGLTGQVHMNFEISGAGSLNFARVAKSSLGNSGVEQCISTRMMTWAFPKPLGGVNVKVDYPFLLRPSST